jgi:hypothetical protein
MIRVVRRWLARIAVVLPLISPASAWGQATDVPGWQGVRWGMNTAELDTALGRGVQRLKSRLDYGLYYADRMVPEVRMGDARFAAMFQMDKGSGRLRQILLEMRRPAVSPKSYGELLKALRGRYGAPFARCFSLEKGQTPKIADIVWRLGSTTARAVFLDFHTTQIFTRDPNIDIDPLEDFYKVQRNNPHFLPQRILVRLSDSDDPALTGTCEKPS